MEITTRVRMVLIPAYLSSHKDLMNLLTEMRLGGGIWKKVPFVSIQEWGVSTQGVPV